LGQDTGDSAHGKRDSNTLLIPPVSCQVDRQEWSDARLHVCEKEVQPVETTERSGGRHLGELLGFDAFREMPGWVRGREISVSHNRLHLLTAIALRGWIAGDIKSFHTVQF
jgi:hypothetical protein